MHKFNNHQIPYGILFVLFISLLYTSTSFAEFVLDWAADGTPTFSGTSAIHGGSLITGQTPFIYERVTDPDNGAAYYHMIVGNPSDGFGQEIYIKLGNTSTGISFGLIGPINSSSGGATTTGTGGNGEDPLGVANNPTFTGNATGNPNTIQMQEFMTDSEISIEFLKDKYTNKPVITQSIKAPDITSDVVIDNRNSTYSDPNTPGNMSYTMSLDNQPDFNLADDAQDSTVTAGRYIYTPGPGGDGSGGTYNYSTDTFNLGNINWMDFYDPGLNNPWSFNANQP